MKKVRDIKPFQLTISQIFHEKTKISVSKPGGDPKDWPKEWKTVYFKGYPRFKALKLTTPKYNSLSFEKVMFGRKSCRDFSKKRLEENEISTLLYFSAGIREENSTWVGNRFYPSAGARYPLEVYPIILRANGIKKGLYHYYIKKHLLEILPHKPRFKQLAIKYFGLQPWVKDVGMLFAISAVFYRNKVKYNERGYRHVLAEMGAMLQNIYLSCSLLGLGCCATGGYVDNGYNSLLDLDGIEESIIAVVAVGKPSV